MMDFDPQHDQTLDLPLSFPGDPVEAPRPAAAATAAGPKSQQQQQQRPQSRQKQHAQDHLAGEPSSRSPAEPSPTFTVYIRVPAPRNGFVDPPDVNWSREKDDALWRILSRASKNDIDWEELAENFEATVDFLLIQATILTERHVSQVRAQTRKVATLGSRDSPMHSPARLGDQSPSLGVGASRFAASPAGLASTPTSEAMGRTLSGGGHALVGRASAETMRRTASAGSRAGARVQSGAGTPSGGSRRPSMEGSQVRPTRPLRPSLDTITSTIKPGLASPSFAANTSSPTGQAHPTIPTSTSQQRRLQSPLPIRPAAPPDGASSHRRGYETEDDEEEEGADLESPAAASSQSSGSSSSTPSEPVMSRIFKRPPGYPPQQQQQRQQQQQQQRDASANRPRGQTRPSGGDGTDFGNVGLGISSGGSDDGDESETQAAFLPFKSPTLAATAAAKAPAGKTGGSRHHQHQGRQQRRTNRDASSPSSSASASPTTKAFKTSSVAANAARAVSTGSPSTASAVAAARLQSTRLPGVRSPPVLHHTLSGRSAAAAKGVAPGISREGSDTGTTPSIGSSFSDLDDVSFTQSVLDEALGSKVEDTVVTPNPNNTDPMSSSASRRQR